MTDITSRLIVGLIDRLTGPSRAISSALGRLNAAATANAARMNAVRGQMMDAVGMGYLLAQSLSAPIKAAVAFESKLEDIGQKADIPQKRLAELGKQLRLIGRQTNQAGSEMAEGMDTLLGLGASEGDALKLLPNIGKAAFAYKASITDLSSAGYAALDNLKVPADQFGKALDAMAQAGKAGAFELKDMAQYFPALGAGYQALGQTGVPAVADLSAALQIVRKGTGDSASAATNLSNVLQKIRAPQTVKAFKKMGVNLERELKKRAEAGMSPIEAIADITNKTLKGDLGKLGDLFSDAQVQQGLRPLIQNMEEYRRIRAEAMAASGTVEADFQRRMKTSEGALLRMQAALENVSASIGAALLPALNQVIDKVAPVITGIADLAERYPQATSAIVAATAAVVGFRVALTAIQFAGLFAKGSLISMASTVVTFAGALLSALNPLKIVRTALVALRFALMSTGIGAILIGVAAAGTWIYNNWSGLSTLFTAFGSSFRNAVEPIMPLLRPVIDAVSNMYGYVSNLLGPVDGLGRSWFAMGRLAGKALGDVAVSAVKFATELPSMIAAIDWSALGAKLVSSFASINWAGVGESIGAAIRGSVIGAFDFASALISSWSGSDAESMALTVGSAIAAALIAFDWLGLGGKILSAIGSGLLAGAQLVRGLIKGLFNFDVVEDGRRLATSLLDGVSGMAASMVQAGKDLMYGLWEGIKVVMSEIIAYIKSALTEAFASAASAARNLASNLTFGLVSGDSKPTGDTPAVDGARAKGGPVGGGKTYLVGEKGPELFSPGRSGVISTNDAYNAAAAGSAAARGGTGKAGRGDTYINVHLPAVNVSGVSDPVVAANTAMSQMGASIKSAVESAYSD